MGAPSINIAFIEKSASAIQRGERGVIAMLLKESSGPKNYTVYSVADIPEELSDTNKGQLEMALKGYQNAPKKILVYVMESASVASKGYTDALNYFATQKWDYLVIPSVETDEKTETVASWIKTQRTNNKRTYKAVLPNSPSDCEGIINVTSGCKKGETEYTAEEMCSRVAGIICGTPLTISCTYAPLAEMTDCDRLGKEELDAAVDAGKFVFTWDGEKVKVCRGVNSFVTTTDTKGESFKKIKVVDAMDLIRSDIEMTAQDNYIGRYANSYDNKCLLLTSINSYFSGLVRDGILASGACEIDIDAQRNYFAGRGGTVVIDGVEKKLEDCTDDEVKKGNTGSMVFLKAVISILDAIEDIALDIYIG